MRDSGTGGRGWACDAGRPRAHYRGRHLQFSYFDERKDVTRNVRTTDAGPVLDELIGWSFGNAHLTTAAEETDLQISKKGKVLVRTKAAVTSVDAPVAHNRVKDQPLPEGKADRLLEVMGVMTAGGQVKPSMRAKFTQINEFLRQLIHTLDVAELRQLPRPLELLDCGCGSSHLTLAAHHYLNDMLGVPAKLIGVDVNEEVIRKSVEKAERAGANDLVTAREDRNSQAAMTEHVAEADGGQRRDVLRTQEGAGLEQHGAGGDVLAGLAHVGAGLQAARDGDGDAALRLGERDVLLQRTVAEQHVQQLPGVVADRRARQRERDLGAVGERADRRHLRDDARAHHLPSCANDRLSRGLDC